MLSSLVMPLVLGCGSDPTDDIATHIEAFKDNGRDGMVQADAMYALVAIGKPAVPELTTALASDNVDVRLMALNTLALIGAEATDALPEIKKLLDDPDTDVQNRAQNAIDKIGG